MIAVFYEATEA